ncbi:DUF421 domain-containing protein [Anaerosalibacter bizertensis]|uniref:DUF421 domain-containing protein n=1 Tax=Anaerosalibacter bizertensis TaxID=932217 RepID=A0A9Q4ACK2_9FIRM|nr:DUF421 domain-containing protein [Anaerosalibacter bizertensis]MBV1817097.1 DUF421 domain-containing protein [Bacteroidales bacterium MSK.15.36]MCB5558927.1 DUF421 domain-containing protein [Anaerosalibacter bizertensis]MCG4564872.1 DUF421 domain-containing protein [Anaerosalibacter bizertensis]MCG4581593.1 DUF421 domain-containing protein [Anaerosalibacter bizertensis]MCG4585011.1 DUF421 domain-containing protein [Anaerosalibacter bizertensis]
MIVIEFSKIILKTTLTFITLLILTRMLGKKQLSELTFFNYITGVTIGSLAANTIINTSSQYLNEMIKLIWWILLTIFVTLISLKSSRVRVLLEGEPIMVIKNGKIVEEALKSTKINLDDLSMLLRSKDIFSITEVDYAILESNGELSILKKQENQKTQNRLYMPIEIIIDGNLVYRNLKELNIDKTWIYKELKNQGINSIEEVLYGEIQEDGSLYIDKKS